MVPGSRLLDAPPADLSVDDVIREARSYDLVVIHTSTPSLSSDAGLAGRLKDEISGIQIGFVGPQAMVLPEDTLKASSAIDFVVRGEFDHAVTEIAAGKPLSGVDGIAYRENGSFQFTPNRPPLQDLDSLPFVSDVYARDLRIEDYFIGYLLHPYLSLYTGRGCRSHCTFCLWPQTISGHKYRVRSVENVLEEMARARELFPQVKEYFFDDDTFTDDLPRAEKIARGLGKLGITWSCNAKPNVPRESLKVMRENGLRLLLVGFESGNEQILRNIKKGVRMDRVREFVKNTRELDIRIHGAFVLGLPGETRETIEETIRFAQEIDIYSLQVSLAAPYPGTALYKQAEREGWLTIQGDGLVRDGVQDAALSYPGLDREEIYRSVERFYRRFYFRPRPILRIFWDMLKDFSVFKRRIREGAEFVTFMSRRRKKAG